MPTQAQIVEFVRTKHRQHDPIGLTSADLIGRLDFEHAKEFLKAGTTAEEWEESRADFPTDVEAEAREYMSFAWGKCLDHRGLSASRSIEHFRNWFFLAEDAEALRIVEETQYAPYGAPILAAICKHKGWPIPEDDEDNQLRRMLEGGCCESCYT